MPVVGSNELDSEKRCATTEFSVLCYQPSIAQDHPTGWYHISLRSLTTELKEPNQRCTPDANRWECVSDRRGAAGGPARKRRTEPPQSATAAHPMQRNAGPTNPWPRPRAHRQRSGGHAPNTTNEDNRLTQSTTGDNVVTDYRYDAQGTRRVKYSRVYGETLYADRMYQEHVGTTPTAAVTKHIFVGQTRIASKLHYTDQTPSTRALYMQQNTFWYHPDHLGSTNWVTDAQGEGYEHFTYTPYGEAWVEEHLSSKIHRMSHRFTGQELDPETGLYAFPARNYDPRTSRWLSADPALGNYLPSPGQSPMDLPGMGGVFTSVNLQPYHYAGNNPLKYHDPTGLYFLSAEDGNAYLNIEEGDTLSQIVQQQTPNLSSTEIYDRVAEIAELNNIENPDQIKPGQKFLAPESVVPDITDDLFNRMQTNAQDRGRQNPFYFREKVQDGGDWDLKSLDGTVYDSTPLGFSEFLFDGQIVRYDAPGNIHYGYVGRSTWFGSRGRLLRQAGYAQVRDNSGGGWTGDDPYDATMIILGMDLYEASR